MTSQLEKELNKKVALRYAAVVASLISVWAVLPTAEASAQACVPDCRDGYTCQQGQCVSACNPACSDGAVCDAAGECTAVLPTYSAVNRTRSAHLDDNAKPRIVLPATFVALGGFLMVAGGVTFGTAEHDDFGYWTGGHYAGLGLMTMGTVSLLVATPFLAIRAREKRERERSMSSRKVEALSLAPRVSPSGKSKEYGFTLRGSF